MKKEQKVISLKLVKELQNVAKEKGFELPESEYYWKAFYTGDNEIIYGDIGESNKYNCYPAYDTAELGEMLKNYELECIWFPEENKFGAFQTCSGINTLYAKTEANARRKMLIYLIKNNKIK